MCYASLGFADDSKPISVLPESEKLTVNWTMRLCTAKTHSHIQFVRVKSFAKRISTKEKECKNIFNIQMIQ